MKKILIVSTAAIGVLAASSMLATPANSQSVFSPRASAESQALTVDRRGVLTMAPLLERVTPAVVSIETSGKKASTSSSSRGPSSEMSPEELLERFFGPGMRGQQRPNTQSHKALFRPRAANFAAAPIMKILFKPTPLLTPATRAARL